MTLANPTAHDLPVVLRVTYSHGKSRTTKATVSVGGTYGATVRTLSGSLASDPRHTLVALSATCDGGRVACPVSLLWHPAPVCVPSP